MQLLDKSVEAGSDFFQKDYKMLHDTVQPFRTETVQLPEITGRTEKTFQLWGLSGKPLPGSAPRSFFALRTELLQTDFWEKKQLFQKETMECVIFELKNIQNGDITQKIRNGPEKAHTVAAARGVVSCCHSPEPPGRKEEPTRTMGQRKTSRGLDSLSRATDILSTLLAQQVRELNARQRENRRSGAEDPGTMKGLKEATAVLKDLAAVARSLNDQGVQAEGTESGVVLLPRVEEEEP